LVEKDGHYMIIEYLKSLQLGQTTLNETLNKYILLGVLVCSVAVYFYESKYKWRVKIYSDATH